MYKNIKNVVGKLVLLTFGFFTKTLFAQSESMQTKIDQNLVEQLQGGYRYNAVVVVLVIIFIGLWLFLYRMDKRINKLEGKIK